MAVSILLTSPQLTAVVRVNMKLSFICCIAAWGYRLMAMMQYHSFMDTAVTATPRIFFAHDVKGYSAGPIGPGFVEGVKTVGLGVDFDYQSTYKLSFDYASSFGNRYRNAMADKDFASASFSFTF